MRFREFGATDAETILLLHGGGLSWWNFEAEALLLRSGYHVILPILDGHAGSDRPFTTIEDNAREIIGFIDAHSGGRVLMIGGVSLGAQILLEMLSQRGSVCRCALVESASVVPSRLTHALIRPVFGGSYGLIQNRCFSSLQFRSLHMDSRFFEAYYRDTREIAKADMIAFLRANTAYTLKDSILGVTARTHVFAGARETPGILKSFDILKERVPGCRATLLPGLRHGEFSLNRPELYAQCVRALIADA